MDGNGEARNVEKEPEMDSDSARPQGFDPGLEGNGEASVQQQREVDGDSARPQGFDRGLDLDYIVNVCKSPEGLMFLIKWKDSDDADFVPARIANLRCPEAVISFYEKRIEWVCRREDNGDPDRTAS